MNEKEQGPTNKECPPGTEFTAKEMYVVQRKSLRQIANELDIPLARLSRWSKAENWGDIRCQVAQARADSATNFELALCAMMGDLRESKDPKTATAVAALERVRMKKEELLRKSSSIASNCSPCSTCTSSEGTAKTEEKTTLIRWAEEGENPQT